MNRIHTFACYETRSSRCHALVLRTLERGLGRVALVQRGQRHRGSARASPLKHAARATAPQSAEGRLQRADRTAAAAAREDASTERFSRTQARACSAPTQCTESEAKATMASAT